MALNGFNSKALKAGDPEPAPPQPGTFRLYSMRFCPYAERAFLYAAKKNLPVEVVNINLVDKPEWYFKKHYQGKVPTLEHDGKLVIESAFIPLYLDDLFPESSILPKCPYGKIKQQILADRLGMVSTALFPLFGAIKDPSVNKDEKLENVAKTFAEVEKLLEKEFFGGSSPSYSDYMVFPFFERIWWISHLDGMKKFDTEHFPCKGSFPKLTAWFDAMKSQPEVAAHLIPADTAVEFFTGYLKGEPKYDLGL